MTAAHQMSRRRFASARDVVNQPPGTARGAVPHSWGEFRGKPKTWQHPVNENLYPSLSGTRLAVVLHEIRDNLGASDPRLREMADRALQGDFGREGRDIFTDIRDLLRHRASIDTVSPQGQLAGKLANQYAWHRVGAGIKLDRVVADTVRKLVKSNTRLAGSGKELRAAHNFFGLGSEERGHDPSKKAQFLAALRQAVDQSLFSAKGAGDTYALRKPQYTDEMLLRSLRRQAESEHNIEQLGGGSNRSPVTAEGFESYPGQFRNPATTPTGRVSAKATSSQYKRGIPRRYALFGIMPSRSREPVVNGIQYTSHPPEKRGRYSVNDHLAANMEKSAVRHALTTLGVIPPRRSGETPEEYSRGIAQVTEHFLTLARNHIHQNPNDKLSRRYLSAAKNLVVPTSDTDVTGPSGEVSSIDLGTPPEDYTGLLGLSAGVTPIIRRLAHDRGVSFKDAATGATPNLVHNIEEPIDLDKLDLLEAHGGVEPHTVNNPVTWAGREGDTVENLGTPEDFDTGTRPQLGLRLANPRRPQVDAAGIKQSLSNHYDEAFSRGESSPKETSASALQMLQEKHGLSPQDAQRHLRNFVRGQRKPAAEPTQPTKRVWPPVSRKQRQYAAYSAPAGGPFVFRGTTYQPGERVPDPKGKFANPPIKEAREEIKFDPKKLAKVRRKMMVGVLDEGTGGVTLPGSTVSTRKST